MQTESLIKLLTETLKFYAEEANYVNDQVKKDNGVQARHVLKLVENNEKTLNSYDKMFDEFIKETKKETTEEDIVNFLKRMKHTTENYE